MLRQGVSHHRLRMFISRRCTMFPMLRSPQQSSGSYSAPALLVFFPSRMSKRLLKCFLPNEHNSNYVLMTVWLNSRRHFLPTRGLLAGSPLNTPICQTIPQAWWSRGMANSLGSRVPGFESLIPAGYSFYASV